jgi:Subtilase family
VLSIDTPPSIELEDMELLDIDNPRLPGSLERVAAGPPVVIIDGGVIPGQPLIRRALDGPVHRSFIPGTPSVNDGGLDGHGTAIASVAAIGSLRQKLLQPTAGEQVLPVAVARVLDDNTALPETVKMKSALPEIAGQMRQRNGARVFNHSLASRAPFNRQRMSVWAEALDRTAYDNGGPDTYSLSRPAILMEPYHPRSRNWKPGSPGPAIRGI